MSAGHTCFGCDRPLKDLEPHIHVGMDEWAAKNGLPLLGMDDLLPAFAFCIPCTEKSENGWMVESHRI